MLGKKHTHIFLFLGTHFLLIRKGNRNLAQEGGAQYSTTSVHCIVYYYVIAEQQRGELQQGKKKQVAEQSCRMCTLCFCSLLWLYYFYGSSSAHYILLLTRKQKAHFFSFSIECSFSPLAAAYLTCSLFFPILFWPLLGPFFIVSPNFTNFFELWKLWNIVQKSKYYHTSEFFLVSFLKRCS